MRAHRWVEFQRARGSRSNGRGGPHCPRVRSVPCSFLPALQVLVHETNLRLDAIARNVPERKLPVVRELSDDATALIATDALCRRVRLKS